MRPAYRQAGAVGVMYYVYVLHSQKDGTFYIGLTNNLERRVRQHNTGQERTTRSHIPYELVLTEEFPTRPEARTREKYYKSGVGRARIRSLINDAEVAERQTCLPAGRRGGRQQK